MRKLQMLKPRLQELDWCEARGIKILQPVRKSKALKEKQQANGRILALDGAAWRKLRAMVLSEEPLCRHCQAQGRITPATDVDHINNTPSDNRREMLQSLCHECHSRKTAAEMGYNVAMGCDESGAPLDSNHPWNVAQKAGKSLATDGHKPAGSLSFYANRKDKS